MISTEYSFPAKQTADFLRELGEELSKLEPLLRDLVRYYRTEVQPAIFEAHAGGKNGGAGHPPWQPLSARYLASELKRTSQHPRDILQLTGAFREDLTTGTIYTREEYRVTKTDAYAEFGSLRVYPRYSGAAQGGPRQAMYLTPEAVQRMDEMVNSWLSKKIVEERKRRIRQGERVEREITAKAERVIKEIAKYG